MEGAEDSFSRKENINLLRYRIRMVQAQVVESRRISMEKMRSRQTHEEVSSEEDDDSEDIPMNNFPNLRRECNVLSLNDLVSQDEETCGYIRREPDIITYYEINSNGVELPYYEDRSNCCVVDGEYCPVDALPVDRLPLGKEQMEVELTSHELNVYLDQDDYQVEVCLQPLFKLNYAAVCVVSLKKDRDLRVFSFFLESVLFDELESMSTNFDYLRSLSNQQLLYYFRDYTNNQKEVFLLDRRKHLDRHLSGEIHDHCVRTWISGVYRNLLSGTQEHLYEDFKPMICTKAIFGMREREVLPNQLWYEFLFLRK
jgi:hypothetical protein